VLVHSYQHTFKLSCLCRNSERPGDITAVLNLFVSALYHYLFVQTTA